MVLPVFADPSPPGLVTFAPGPVTGLPDPTLITAGVTLLMCETDILVTLLLAAGELGVSVTCFLGSAAEIPLAMSWIP